MVAVQLICARIGLVSGLGLAGAVRRHVPRPLLYTACALVVLANVFILEGLELNPTRLLFLAALVNGLLAPPLLVLVMVVGNSRRIMGDHVSGSWLNLLGWTTVAVMTAAGALFVGTALL